MALSTSACSRARAGMLITAAALAMAEGAHAVENEREVDLSPQAQQTPLQFLGIRTGDLRIRGFLVGSFSYNSHIQMVPEFAGGAPALADPKSTSARFDKFGLGLSETFAPWLSAGAAIEVENHRDRHSHGFNPGFACSGPPAGAPPGPPQPCIERFGTEEAENEVNLDKFNLTAVAPLGNGLALSFARFDMPFGIERHDEVLLLTATTSEVFRFGRPERGTGFQAAYQLSPLLDVNAWVVNRWENEASGDEDFNDNNKGKSFGGRIGITPMPRENLLALGVGGFVGPEQEDEDSNLRWVVDGDWSWSPTDDLLIAGELVYGGEEKRDMRERGLPFPTPAAIKDVNWLGFYILAHHELTSCSGLSLRYGWFDDMDGGRTGVEQVLQSITIAPILHLSRLIPDLGPTGAAYVRTRHPIDWVDLKLEYRFNHSNKDVFSDAEPGVDIPTADGSSHQVQFQVVVNL
jgi:putative OmpL-like beta-barrel porin-2